MEISTQRIQVGDTVVLKKSAPAYSGSANHSHILKVMGTHPNSDYLIVRFQKLKEKTGSEPFITNVAVAIHHLNLLSADGEEIETQKPTVSDEEFLKSLTMVSSSNGLSCNYQGPYGKLNRKIGILSIHGVPISCGIIAINGLNNLLGIPNWKAAITILDSNKQHLVTQERVQEWARQSMNAILDNISAAFVIFSTNITNNNKTEEIERFMEQYSYCITRQESLNPNSRNKIALWVVDLNKYRKMK